MAAALFAALAAAALADPAAHVDPFAGTRPGPHTFGGGHDYPGAALPFGMVQWSPDTTPGPANAGGYDYRDHHLSGFSLTHLSGAGCAVYGDFPFLPTTEPLTGSPAPTAGKGSPGASGRASPTAPSAPNRATTRCGCGPGTAARSASRSPRRRAPGSPASPSPRTRTRAS
ncbi:MAG TPA: hypothetical protein VHA80_01360 [Solirubrobacterales bacterium]|nr:hypothetical protein [Solirubrobacterales bacterium]